MTETAAPWANADWAKVDHRGQLYVLLVDVHGEYGPELMLEANRFGHVLPLWDQSAAYDLHELATKKIGEEEANSLMTDYMDIRLHENGVQFGDDGDEPNFDHTSVPDDGDIYRIHFQDPSLAVSLLIRWSELMSAAVQHVGGDDSYYDYFPNSLMMLEHLAKGIAARYPEKKDRMQGIYNSLIDYCLETTYRHDTEDTIGRWED